MLSGETVDAAEGTYFTAEHLRLVPALLRISKSFRALLDLRLQAIGLELGQDQMLLALGDDHVLSVSEIAERLTIRPSTTSKMVDRLAAKGWVVRQASERDARVTLVRLTEAGESKRKEAVEALERLNEELASTQLLGDEALAALSSMADVLARRLKRLR